MPWETTHLMLHQIHLQIKMHVNHIHWNNGQTHVLVKKEKRRFEWWRYAKNLKLSTEFMGDRCFLSDYRCTLTIPCVGLDRKNNTQCLVHQYLDCSQSHKMCTMGEYRSSKIWCRLIICNIPTCFQHLLYSKKPEYRDYIRKFISFFGMLISFSRHPKCEKRTFYRSVLK